MKQQSLTLQIRDIGMNHAEAAQRSLEAAILATPTGPARNQLTAANIFLTNAINLFKEKK